MPMSLLAEKFYKLVLFGHLCKGMHTFGARHVMLANAQGLEDSHMALSSQLLHLGHLKNGALMPLGLCQEPRRVKSTS